jgi:hypothetical protein
MQKGRFKTVLNKLFFFTLLLVFVLFSHTQAENKSTRLESFTGKIDKFEITNLRMMDISVTHIKVRLVEFPDKGFTIFLKDAQAMGLTKYAKEFVLTDKDSLALQKDLNRYVGRKAIINCQKQKKEENGQPGQSRWKNYESYGIKEIEVIK